MAAGAGPVAQAWRTIRRLVARSDVASLLRGLQRLRVVSIGLDANEDPQQIFESLNATGRPLTESEKVKNWLLMGLPDTEQQELHDEVWLRIEEVLGAEHATEPVDEFLRDLLRWRTGRVQGIDAVYDGLRRWAVRGGYAADRPGLCRELAKLAKHYGVLTGAAGAHPNQRVERELRHLRAMGIDVHRPLTMRLMHDADQSGASPASNAELADALGLIGAWITRLWLADRPMAGLNKAVAELAYGRGPREDGDLAGYWRGRVDGLPKWSDGSSPRRSSERRHPNQEGVRWRSDTGGLCRAMRDDGSGASGRSARPRPPYHGTRDAAEADDRVAPRPRRGGGRDPRQIPGSSRQPDAQRGCHERGPGNEDVRAEGRDLSE